MVELSFESTTGMTQEQFAAWASTVLEGLVFRVSDLIP
jgi:hypothetical protein